MQQSHTVDLVREPAALPEAVFWRMAGKEQEPLAIEYHGKETAQGHWRKQQDLVDALAYIDPLTPDVKQQVDKLIEEEMRRSTLKPQDYLNKLPAMPPAKFEGHPLLQKEYER